MSDDIPFFPDELGEPGPVTPKRNPKGGRPRDAMGELANQVTKGVDYYLANADRLLVFTTAHELPLRCQENCAYQDYCYTPDGQRLPEDQRPRSMENGHPEYGMRCPVECQMIYTLFFGYCAELGIDPARPTEIQTAAELAGIQVWKRRINARLSEDTDGMLMVEQAKVVRGEIAITRESHPLFAQKKYFDDREAAILKQFHATREQSKKFEAATKVNDKKTAAEWLADLPEDVIIDVPAKPKRG